MRSENATKKPVNGMNNRDRSNTAMSHSTVVDLSHLEPSAPQKPTRQEEEIVISPREGGSSSSSMSTKGPTQLKDVTPAPAQLKEVTPAPTQLNEVTPALPKTGESLPSSMSTEETTRPAEITEILPKKTLMQVFFKEEQNKYTSHKRRLNPISLKSSRGFEVSVSTSSLRAGWYWAVFQVSLNGVPENALNNIIFDVTSTTKTSTESTKEHAFTTSTVVMKDEIATIQRTKPESVRLRLHRQVEVSPNTDLSISITVETLSAFKGEVSFDLHYFELTLPNVRRETDVEDHVLWGEGRPDQFIRIGVEDPEFEKESVAIEAYDISDNGKLAVTVYFTQNATSDVLATKSTSATKTTLATKKTPAAKNVTAKNGPAASSALASESEPAASSDHPAQSAATAPPTGFASTAGAASSTGGQFTYDAATGNFQGLTKPSPLSPLGVAHIDVWDLGASSGPPSTTNPPGIVKPFARGSFIVPALKGISEDLRINARSIINISSDGSQIVIARGRVETSLHAAPFIIFRQGFTPGLPAKHRAKGLKGLVNRPKHPAGSRELPPPSQTALALPHYSNIAEPCPSLQKYFGLGSFHNSDQDERYLNIRGCKLDIYSTNDGWKRMHSLSFGMDDVPLRSANMLYLRQSLRGRYFAWTGDIGAVSIWNFEMGKIISSIPIPEDKRGVGAALSEDGYMIAISVNGRIQVHDVASGIELGRHPAEWKEDNDLEMIFRREYFMALDAKKPTSGNKNIYARSVFRVRDMKIVKTRNVFWQYKTEFSSTGDPIFAYRQGTILNIKRLDNVLSPADVDGCGPDKDCEFLNTKLNLNNNSWVDQNTVRKKGTTFNVENTHDTSRTFNIRKLKITVDDDSAILSLGPASENHHHSGFFMAFSSQLVLISNGFLQVWRLPSASSRDYELLHVEAFVAPSERHANDICMTKVSSVQSCTHGRKFEITIEPIQRSPVPKKDEANDASAEDKGNDVSAEDKGNDVSTKDEANDVSAKDKANDAIAKHKANDAIAKDEPNVAIVKDEAKEKITSNGSQLLTFPMTNDRMLSTTEKYRYNNGIASLIDTYANSDEAINSAIVGFLVDRIRPSSQYSSSLVILCRSWKDANQAIFEKLLAKLLPTSDRHTWIPDINAAKKEDPLSVLMKTAKKNSSVKGACKIIMSYCVDHAFDSKNLSFLSPFLRNLKKIVALFPDEARRYLVKIARIRVDDSRREYVVENIIVSYPPWHYILFWKTPSKINDHVMQLPVRAERQHVHSRWRKYFIQKLVAFSLFQYNHLGITILSLDRIKDLTMQFPASSKQPRNKVDAGTRPIFVATFDALWHFKDIGDCNEENSGDTLIRQESTTLQGLTAEQERMRKEVLKMESEMMKKKSARKLASTKQLEALEQEGAGPITQQTTWWKTLYHIFKLKLHLKTHNYVTRHNFDLDFFENPAIAALVEYKWNTIGYPYWAFRIFFQCVFYALVISAALLQVYHENVGRSQIMGVFVAIIVMGVMFLWLELLQAINNWDRYKRTMYNLVDNIAYSLPIAASAHMLVVLYNNNPVGNTRIVSFSVLAIFHHMLFELRIYKSVCKYVSIIRQSVVEIRVFLLLFGGGILAFSIAFLHVLRACAIPGSCEERKTEFSGNFLGALFHTFFFMGGRYEPVEDELVSEDWGFQFMIGVFFFFTVIVMLNVLIALINKAFGKGDNAWRLDWIEARLHYIETAENFSYHVPGFRETYNCFPKEIYFFSKAQEEKIRASEKKDEESAKIDAEKEQLKTLMQELKDQLASVQELKTQLESVQESSQKRSNEPPKPLRSRIKLKSSGDVLMGIRK